VNSGGKSRVLIVDDAEDIQFLLSSFFKSEGYSIAEASNGVEALAYLRTTSDLPDVILLDLMMPKMDGFGFRAEQEKDSRLAGIPVIVMTADSNIQANTIKIGAKAFLKKPFIDPDTILKVVEEVLKK
jgi:two-component system, chemotaxis family, chemotaxis protein CheY